MRTYNSQNRVKMNFPFLQIFVNTKWSVEVWPRNLQRVVWISMNWSFRKRCIQKKLISYFFYWEAWWIYQGHTIKENNRIYCSSFFSWKKMLTKYVYLKLCLIPWNVLTIRLIVHGLFKQSYEIWCFCITWGYT